MKRYMVLLVGLLLACCQQNEVGKLEGNDPGQIECLTEELKELLSKNIEFKEGKIICHLNEEDALGEGVSRSAYQYLMKYLQEEQQRIDQYLEEGAIVFINGIPYTNNEALYQYVDTVRGINTRAETATLIHRQKLTSDMVNSYCDFLGPAEIMLGATEGSVCLREYQKNFVAYLNSMGVGPSSAKFRWGTGNNVVWNWRIEQIGNLKQGEKIELQVWGAYEYPDFSDPKTPRHDFDYSFPFYCRMNTGNHTVEISCAEPGAYMAQLFAVDTSYVHEDGKVEYSSSLYSAGYFGSDYEDDKIMPPLYVPAAYSIALPYPDKHTFMIAFYIRIDYGPEEYNYECIGESWFPFINGRYQL